MLLQLLVFRDHWLPTESDWEFIFFALVVGVGWWGYKFWQERQAQSWPVTQGKVESTQVRVEGVGEYERKIPEVYYSYTVNGEYYAGSHEIFRVDFDKYPKGSAVLVHYKPSDPSVSFLDLRDMRAHIEAEEPIV